MKQKCSFILKASVALVLTLLMLLGSISSVIAATIDMSGISANVDLADTGDTNYYISGSIPGSSITNWPEPSSTQKMTLSTDGYYYYYYLGTVNGTDCAAKIFSSTGWDNNTVKTFAHQNYEYNSSNINNLQCDYIWGNSDGYSNIDFKINNNNKSNVYAIFIPSGSVLNSETDDSGVLIFYTASSASDLPDYTPAATYDVTTSSYTNGSVTASPTSAAEGETVTLTAEPNYGYALSTISVTKSGGGNVTLSGSGNTRTFSMPAANVSVSATFTKKTDMNLYIAGRFHIYNGSSWVNSFDSNDWSNTGDDNIKFTWDSTAQKYKVNTGASPAELTSQISNINPYFFVYDTDNSKSWYATSSTTLTDSNKSVTLSKSSGANNNLRFDSTTTDKPVTLWFDPTTGVLSYTIPTFYDVAVTSVTGGTVTASPSRCEAGTSVTLTIAPATGYQLSSITAKDASNNTVALSGSGNSRTFTMPAKNVTVTPAWSKINYTLTKNTATHGSFILTNSSGTEISTAQYNTTVKVVPTPDTGYQTGTVARGTSSSLGTAISSNEFTMPASNQYVGVSFTEITGTVKGAAYTSGSASTTGGTVNNASVTVGIETVKSITASKKTNYSFTGWQFSGDKTANVRYRFGTSGEWLTPTAGTTYGTSSDTTIYLKTDGSSSITTSNAEVRALFVETTYNGLTAVAKYSTTGAENSYTNTWSTGGPNLTISPTSGTNQNGVSVTAPATDPTGYQFAGWYSANGTFANAANKDTTFKPNAANAIAVAKYTKIYSITTSVNASGTGAGAAPTIAITSGAVEGYSGTDKILAGGSYTITANPTGSYSALDTIVVNNGTATTTSPKTVSSVSGDQSVVVKYKSIVYLRGSSTIGTNWTTGDVMTANADGTKYTKSYTNVAGSSGGTEYQFKQYVTDWSSDGSADITITGNASTGTCTHQSDGNKNYVLTLYKECNVTIESDGSKITSITVRPTTIVQKAITFKHVEGVTITGEYDGTSFSTASADAIVNVYEGDDINFTVTPASTKYISSLTGATFTPAFVAATHSTGYEGKIASVSADATVTPAAAEKLTIRAVTNKSARGTVSVDKSTAALGETITITVTPKNGILKSVTYTYDGESTANVPTLKSGDGIASTSALPGKFDLAATGADIDGIAATGSASTYEFTLSQAKGVTVDAVYDAYSGVSNYYYSGYDTSGNLLSNYDTKQLTESMLSGEAYSYYHVEGRSDTNQLFTIFTKPEEQGYIYFTQPSAYGYWSKAQAPKAYFWNNDGRVGDAWPGTSMTYYDVDNSQNRYRIRIPDGATNVKFSDGSSSTTNQVTNDITLSTGVGGYYIGNNAWNNDAYNATSYTVGNSDPEGLVNGTVYYNYKDDVVFKTGELGFTKTWENWNVNSHSYARPNEDMSDKDYYIIVLYPGKTYTIDNTSYTVGSTYPAIFWSTELPGDGDETVTVYAKDGAIRSESYGSTYANIADTQIVANASSTTSIGTSKNGNISGQTYETYKAGKGETIYIRTTINTTAGNGADTTTNRDKYYVRGFCINGEVYELYDYSSDGVYTTSYKIPEDYEDTKVEITPIYYLKDTTASTHPIVTFRVTNFPKNKYNWGDTLYAYPFYGKLGSQNNAFGAYPGQPLVYYKGQYQIQIPEQSTAWDLYLSDGALTGDDAAKKTQVSNTNVSGVTMSNGYYDIVHRQIMGYGDNGSSSDHVQTYDYGDFYKIFNENENVDNIVFDFKYRTTKHNLEDDTTGNSIAKNTLTDKYTNGFELLTNFHGRNVDLFGTPLSGDAADPETTSPVYVVSTGGVTGTAGVENVAGYYATEWRVYAPNSNTPSTTTYKKIEAGGKSSIPPEVLVLNSTSSFNTTVYPSADSDYEITAWQPLYEALEDYRGRPVYISYEAADAQIGSKNYASSGGGGATRNDGRWLYSKTGENITSNIKIQYSTDNGGNYTDLNTTTPQVSGLSAYFTNTEVEEGAMTFSTTIDPDKTFDFEAKTTNASYMFVGWYMDDDEKTLITTDNASHTERSGSYTFIARFMLVTDGQLILQHTSIGEGSGTSKVSAVVKNGDDEVVATYAESSTITIPRSVIKSTNGAYSIEVTLKATPSGYDTFSAMTCEDHSGDVFFPSGSPTVESGSRVKTFTFHVSDLFTGTTQNVNSLMYHSSFNKTTFTYNFTFSYDGRLGTSNQTFTRSGTLTPSQVDTYVKEASGSYTLDKAFITTLVPRESNFNKTLTWDITDCTSATTAFSKTYTAAQSDDLTRTATFVLPYEHTDGVPNGTVPIMSDESTNLILEDLTYGLVIKNGTSYITAPDAIYDRDNDKTQYFQYWEIRKAAANAEDRVLITKCYNAQFNYAVYEDYYITPIYRDTEMDLTALSDASTSISYLDTTRNQWNNGGNGGYTVSGISTADARNAGSDILFNDFALSYNYNDRRLDSYDEVAESAVEVGFIVEKLQVMDIKQDGSYDTNVSRYIPTDSDEINDAKDAAEYAIQNITGVTKGSAKTQTVNGTSYTKYTIDRTQLDNKNRIEFYYALYNAYNPDGTTGEFSSNTTNKKYVYRAYSYIKVGNDYTLCEDPVYFIMYDEATK